MQCRCLLKTFKSFLLRLALYSFCLTSLCRIRKTRQSEVTLFTQRGIATGRHRSQHLCQENIYSQLIKETVSNFCVPLGNNSSCYWSETVSIENLVFHFTPLFSGEIESYKVQDKNGFELFVSLFSIALVDKFWALNYIIWNARDIIW